MQIYVAQHDADRTSLRCSLLVRMNLAILQDACLQPAPDQTDHARIADAVLHEPEHPLVTETPEEILQVCLQHPTHLAASDHLIEGCQGVMGSPARPPAERPRGAFPVYRVSGCTRAGYPAHGIPCGERTEAWAPPIPRSSPSLPSQSGRPLPEPSVSESETDLSIPVPA